MRINDQQPSKQPKKPFKNFLFSPQSCLPAAILNSSPDLPPKPAGRKPYRAKKLVINLAPDKWDKAKGEDSLGVLLQQALQLLNPHHSDDELSRCHATKASWLVKQILRGGLEEVIRTGHIPLPYEVTFTAYWASRVPGFRFESSRS